MDKETKTVEDEAAANAEVASCCTALGYNAACDMVEGKCNISVGPVPAVDETKTTVAEV